MGDAGETAVRHDPSQAFRFLHLYQSVGVSKSRTLPRNVAHTWPPNIAQSIVSCCHTVVVFCSVLGRRGRGVRPRQGLRRGFAGTCNQQTQSPSWGFWKVARGNQAMHG